jgi:tetratricopeptide (TPR) repeat protein
MNKSISSLFILLILLSTFGTYIGAQDEETKNLLPEVALDYPTEATPNQEIKITVKVKNTVNDVMWDTLAYIDEDSMTKEAKAAFQIVEGKKLFPVRMDPDQEQSVILTIKVTTKALSGEYLVPVVVATGIGGCREGCEPSLLTVFSTIKIKRNDPLITLEFDKYQIDIEQGVCEVELVVPYLPNIPFRITNINNTESAYNLKMTVIQDTPMVKGIIDPPVNQSVLQPGGQITGSLYIRASYEAPIGNQVIRVRLAYADKYGADYDLFRDITVTVKNVGKNYYDQGRLYYDSCDYENAKISLDQAKVIYQDNNNILVVQEIDKLIKRMEANDKFMQGQNRFFSGDLKNAITYYSEAKTLYTEINDCQAVQLCEDAMKAANRPLGGILGGVSGSGGESITTFSIHTIIEIALAIIVAILLIILIRGKGGGRKFNLKGKITRPSQKPISRPSQEPIRPVRKEMPR